VKVESELHPEVLSNALPEYQPACICRNIFPGEVSKRNHLHIVASGRKPLAMDSRSTQLRCEQGRPWEKVPKNAQGNYLAIMIGHLEKLLCIQMMHLENRKRIRYI
jgi:hypothetical protein